MKHIFLHLWNKSFKKYSNKKKMSFDHPSLAMVTRKKWKQFLEELLGNPPKINSKIQQESL